MTKRRTRIQPSPPVADPEVLRQQASPPQFDLYRVTAPEGDHRKFLDVVEDAVGRFKTKSEWAGGFYAHRLNLIRDGRIFGHVAWGGNNAKYPKLEATGEITPSVVDGLRRMMPGQYQLASVHSRVPFIGRDQSLFLRMVRIAKLVKDMDKKVRGERRGDWDFPDGFHAYTVGSEENTYVSIYEAGKKRPERGLPYWVQAEVRCQPKGEMKRTFCELQPHEIWGATKFSRRLATALFDASIEAHPYRPSAKPKSEEEKLFGIGFRNPKTIRKYLEQPGNTPHSLGQFLASAAAAAHAIQKAKNERYLIGGTNDAFWSEPSLLERMMEEVD